jgi:hypothetical protein
LAALVLRVHLGLFGERILRNACRLA